MRRRTWLLVGVGVAAVVAAGVVAVRTAEVRPSRPIAGAAGPAPVAVDTAAAAARLGQAVRIQTVSHQDARENDGGQWEALHAWLATTYPHFAAASLREDVPGGRGLLWTWKGADASLAPIVLMAHQDVVPVAAETAGEWRHAPFSGEVADGAVWGRGSVDDKGSLVAIMEAADALAAKGFRPARTIMIESGHDEEAGGQGALSAAGLLKARGVKPLFAIDEGSAVVLDHPATGGAAAIVGVAEKGYATLTVTAHGAGGHSSAPPKDTAVATLATAVSRIAAKPFPLKYGGLTAQMMEALAPSMPITTRMAVVNAWLFAPLLKSIFAKTPQGAAMLHTTLAPTMLEGSPKANVLPQTALARINYRIAPGDTSRDVMRRARRAVGDLPVTLAFDRPLVEPSQVSSATSEGWRRVEAALAGSYGGRPPPIVPGLVIAGTDGKAMNGVAQDVYRLQPIAFRLKDTEMIHGVNEHLALSDLARMIDFYARIMAGAAR